MANTILLKGELGRIAEEKLAAAALKPGHLLMRTSLDKVQKHNAAGDLHELTFALEDAFQGKTIDDAYALNDQVRVHHAIPGERINARLPANAAAVDFDDWLVSNGDGCLVKASALGGGENLFVAPDESTPIVATVTTAVPYDVTYDIPANSLKAGDVVRVAGSVKVLDNNGTDTLTVTVLLDAQAIAASPAVDVADNDICQFELDITFRSVGATGKMVVDGQISLGVPGTATVRSVHLAETTVDTTQALTVSVTQTWSAAHADNEAQLEQLNIGMTNTSAGSKRLRADAAVDNSAVATEAMIPVRVV